MYRSTWIYENRVSKHFVIYHNFLCLSLFLLFLWYFQLRDGPLEILWGGGGGRSTKNNSRKGKLNEKNSCTPINPKKNSYKEFDNEEKFLRLDNSPPHPPITFLMVRRLINCETFILESLRGSLCLSISVLYQWDKRSILFYLPS